MEGWRRCGPCKKMIGFDSTYYVCSVSTCRKHVFCSHECWRAHVPLMRHKDAWTEEERSPKQIDFERAKDGEQAMSSKIINQTPTPGGTTPKEVLIVASKLKAYVKAKSGLNTSANVLDKLSDMVRVHCDRAIEEAMRNGRKTLMDRDFYS